jgi:hypothetical protein
MELVRAALCRTLWMELVRAALCRTLCLMLRNWCAAPRHKKKGGTFRSRPMASQYQKINPKARPPSTNIEAAQVRRCIAHLMDPFV